MLTHHLILLALMLPLLVAGAILGLNYIAPQRHNLRDGVSLIGGIITAICVALIYLRPPETGVSSWVLFQIASGFDVGFATDPLGNLFALIAASLWPLATLYSIGYLRGTKEKNQTRFFIFFAIAIHAALAIAFAKNLITLFIFYEILTFSTYPLIAHKNTPEARRAARLYLMILVSASVVLLLPAILIVGIYAGTFEFAIGGILADKIAPQWAPFLLALFAFGCAKAALMPLHRWLPAAMVAPTPVSALLHAVAVVKAGVFTILKIITHIFGIEFLASSGASTWLIWVAAFTLLAASLIAISKRNLKARLAYSTISQLAYIILGGALATSLAAQGAAFHIATHAAGKITLFFAAGAIYTAHKYTQIDELNGLGRKMPITFAAFTIGALSIIGVPPLSGSISKIMLMAGALDAQQLTIVGVLVVSSLLNLYYLGEPILRGFFATPKHGHTGGEAPLNCIIPIIATATIALLLFFFADSFIIAFGEVK